jgi:hypothetical protein
MTTMLRMRLDFVNEIACDSFPIVSSDDTSLPLSHMVP